MMGKPDISGLAHKIKEFPVQIVGSKSYDQAQVCSGGVPLEEIDPKNHGIQKGAGAVSGRRGSWTPMVSAAVYNLQWGLEHRSCGGGKNAAGDDGQKRRGGNFHADF